MKNYFYFLLLTVTVAGYAQAPFDYYDSATGTGYTLKSQLRTIITNGHSDQGYASLWDLYTDEAFRDNYYENDGSLLDMYSENPNGAEYEYTSTSQQCGNYSGEGDCYNREHIVPQSYFDDYQVNPMKNDPFHVVPSDGTVNGARGNLPFGVVGTANYTSSNGSKRGNNINSGYAAGYSGVVFEPIDEFKGDIARSIFYFATRYENFMDNFYTTTNATTTHAKAMFDGSTNKVFSDTFLKILITWHQNDPVSSKEMAINDAIYDYQGNRNPYIDNPGYVCQIWTAACQSLGTSNHTLTNITMYPNPSNGTTTFIKSESALSEIQIYSVTGQVVRDIKTPSVENDTYQITDLQAGLYFVRMVSDDKSAVQMLIVN